MVLDPNRRTFEFISYLAVSILFPYQKCTMEGHHGKVNKKKLSNVQGLANTKKKNLKNKNPSVLVRLRKIIDVKYKHNL